MEVEVNVYANSNTSTKVIEGYSQNIIKDPNDGPINIYVIKLMSVIMLGQLDRLL